MCRLLRNKLILYRECWSRDRHFRGISWAKHVIKYLTSDVPYSCGLQSLKTLFYTWVDLKLNPTRPCSWQARAFLWMCFLLPVCIWCPWTKALRARDPRLGTYCMFLLFHVWLSSSSCSSPLVILPVIVSLRFKNKCSSWGHYMQGEGSRCISSQAHRREAWFQMPVCS